MNEDDIKIQPSAAPLPAETPTPPETPQTPTDTANSTAPEDAVDKVVEITDDLDITPAKDAPASLGIDPVKRIPTPELLSASQSSINRLVRLARPTPDQPIKPVAPIKSVDPIRPAALTRAPHPASNLKKLRTYEGDVAEVLAQKKISTTSIALAEKRRSTGEDRIGSTETPPEDQRAEKVTGSSHAGRKILIGLMSVILIGTGIVIAYYLYSMSPLASVKPAVQQPQAVQSLVPSDTQAVIPIDGMDPTEIISAVRTEMAKSQAPGTIKEIILVQTKNGQHFRLAASDMADIMGIGAPDALLRALSDDWMLGVYSDPDGGKTAFVLATVDYFQDAFAGMLQWESVMADDLKGYLYQTSPADIAEVAPPVKTAIARKASPLTALSAATSAPQATTTYAQTDQAYAVIRGSFVDRIIQNKDVREFVTSDGKILFLYSFIDNTELVITGKESALSDILERLEQQAFVR